MECGCKACAFATASILLRETAPGGSFRFHSFSLAPIGNLVLKIVWNEPKASPEVILCSFGYTNCPRTAQMTGQFFCLWFWFSDTKGFM